MRMLIAVLKYLRRWNNLSRTHDYDMQKCRGGLETKKIRPNSDPLKYQTFF